MTRAEKRYTEVTRAKRALTCGLRMTLLRLIRIPTKPEQWQQDTIFINGDSVEVIGTLPYYRFRNGARSTIEIEYQGAIKIK